MRDTFEADIGKPDDLGLIAKQINNLATLFSPNASFCLDEDALEPLLENL